MNDHERFDAMDQRFDALESKLNEVLDLVAVGKGAYVAVKVLGWCTATGVAIIEIWRTFFQHKG